MSEIYNAYFFLQLSINVIGYYFYYRCDKGGIQKVVYATFLKDNRFELFRYWKNGNLLHDMDLEQEFEVLLCGLTIVINKWKKADGLFKSFKERQVIKELDTLMTMIFQKYFRVLRCVYI